MLAVKRIAGIAPKVSLRECTSSTPLASVNKAADTGLRIPEEKSPEVQNSGINTPRKRTCVHQNFLLSSLDNINKKNAFQ